MLALMGMLDSVHGHAALISPPSRCVPAKPANGALKSALCIVGIVDAVPRRPPPANESPLAPRSNAVDRFLPQFVGNKSPKTSCNCGNAQTGCDAGVRASGGGQPCLW